MGMSEPSAPVQESPGWSVPGGPGGPPDRGEWVQLESCWWADDEPTPPYLRPRFVGGMVLLAALLALLMVRWGSSGNLGEAGLIDSAQPNGAESGDAAVAAVASPESCPAAAGGANLEAAKTIRLFLAATSGERFDGLLMDPEVEAQLGGPGDPAPLLRATRIRGFTVSDGNVSSCVHSWWFDGEGLQSSTDVVTVAPGAKGWTVTGWVRGEPLPQEPTAATQIAYYNGTRSCDDPDRFANVAVPGTTPDEHLTGAIEELLSGTAGRAAGAASQVPADVQLVAARTEGLSATVELTGTAEKLTRCQSSAAYDQIMQTAKAVVLATAPPPEPTTTTRSSKSKAPAEPEVQVEVMVDGQVVTTLRP